MSIATCVTFILVGVVLVLAPRVRSVASATVVRALTVLIAAVGVLALVGYVLNLPEVLHAY